MTKGKQGLYLLLVRPPVAYVYAFLVLLVNNVLFPITPYTWEGCFSERMCSYLIEIVVPRERKTTAWVGVSDEDGSKGRTSLTAKEPALDYCRNLLAPRHTDSIAADIYVNSVAVDSRHRLYQFILSVWQFHSFTVMPLTVLIVTLVQATEDNHIVSGFSLLHGFFHQLFGLPVVFQVLSRSDTVIVAGYIAYIPTGIVNLAYSGQPLLKTVKGTYLMLGFQATGASAYRHHLDGILANDENLLALWLQRQHATFILQQDNSL